MARLVSRCCDAPTRPASDGNGGRECTNCQMPGPTRRARIGVIN